jgi:hypothetical protein
MTGRQHEVLQGIPTPTQAQHYAAPDAAPVPATPEQLPIRDPLVVEALTTISKHDTFDVYAKRLRGTSALGTRAVAGAGVTSLGLGIFTEGFAYGGIELAVPGATTLVAGTAVAGAVYTRQRLTEKRRAQKTEAAQQTVRDAVSEPIDIIRQKDRKDSLILRWYGGDEQYGGQADPDMPKRLKAVADFAKQYGITELVIAANAVTAPSDSKEPQTPPGTPTTTRQLFLEAKGLRIDDAAADTALVRLTPAEAQARVGEGHASALIRPSEFLAKRIAETNSNSQLEQTYTMWQQNGEPAVLKTKMGAILRASLERHFTSNTLGEGIAINGRRFGTDVTVTVQPTGISVRNTPRVRLPDGDHNTVEFIPFTRLTGKNMETFVSDLLPQKDKDGKDIPLRPIESRELWKHELALYHVIKNTADEPAAAVQGRTNAVRTSTLYSRMTAERPRTSPVWPGLRARGKVDKTNQTITYERRFWRETGKKALALGMAAVAGAGLGYGWTDRSLAYTGDYASRPSEEYICKNVAGEIDSKKSLDWEPPTEADKALCEAWHIPLDAFAAKTNTEFFKVNNAWENILLEKAYQLGMLDKDTISHLSSSVSQEFAERKKRDLEQRYNLYGESSSIVGDVKQDGSNPTIWSLTPSNGASTRGYWPANVQDHILLDPTPNMGATLPPYNQLEMKLDDTPDRMGNGSAAYVVPKEARIPAYEESYVERVRVLTVAEKIDMARDPRALVQVHGELLPIQSDTLYFGSGPDSRKTYDAFSLPVIKGGDIIGANITAYDLATDKLKGALSAKILQRDDGTFRLITNIKQDGVYLKINYWIDPKATTAQPLQAIEPMTANQEGEYEELLDELLRPQDVASILKALRLPADANAAQIADAIIASRSYSFTPYTDNPPSKLLSTKTGPETTRSTRELLVGIAKYAENMDSANCNVSFMLGTIASRGRDGKDFINGVTGFNNDGDNILSKVESHQWGVTSSHTYIDDTPIDGNSNPAVAQTSNSPVNPAIAETAKATAEPPINPLIMTANILAGLIAMSAGTYAGHRLTPTVVAQAHRRRRRVAEAWIDRHDDALSGDIRLLKHLLYAPAGAPFTAEPHSPGTTSRPTAKDQLRGLPGLTGKEATDLILEQTANGTVAASPETQRRLRKLMAKTALLNQI